MKKLLLVLAIVFAYGVATSTASTKVVDLEKASVTVVADNNDVDSTTPDGEDGKKADKKSKKECSEENKKSCGDKAAKKCCGEKAAKSCDGKKK